MADWGYGPAVLIFGDTEAGRAMAAASVTKTGARVAAALALEQAIDRLDSQISVDLVILDVTRDHGPLLDRLFRRVEDGATGRNFASIVVISPELVDIATAGISHEDIDLLVGRDPELLGNALNAGLERTQPQLREPQEDREAARLQYLGGAYERLGGPLAASLDDEGHAPSALESSTEALRPVVADFQSIDAAAVRSLIRARRMRADSFGSGLFADPAWDILLDLTAARLEGRSVAVSSLCIAAAVPATTALRWIKQLTETGLLRRVSDPVDGRRVFIELTDSAAQTMTTYFASVPLAKVI